MSDPKARPPKDQATSKRAGLSVHHWALIGLILISVAGFWLGRVSLPFGIQMPERLMSEDHRHSWDPHERLVVEGIGFGTILSEVEIRELDGPIVFAAQKVEEAEINTPLDFGQRYRLSVEAERPWLGQKIHQDVAFETARIPHIESALRQELAPGGSLTLDVSEPVGKITAKGPFDLQTKSDESRQHFTLTSKPEEVIQGQTFSVSLDWETMNGIALPPFSLEVTTAPALGASIPLNGQKNLGIAMPIQIDFSEPVEAREKVGDSIKVTTEQGQTLHGKWAWTGKQHLQFRPEPFWPAHATIKVRIDPKAARSPRGGVLAQPVEASFSTGPDRRIEVYLDRQRVEIYENGNMIKTMKASTGKPKTPTVTGSFYIYARFPTKTMKSTGLKPGEKGYYEVKDVPYAQYFHEGFAFHGAFWHNNFGHPASHGCVNLATQKKNSRQGVNEDAGWLYHWASLGVPVTVHGTSSTKDPIMAGDGGNPEATTPSVNGAIDPR